MKIIKLVREAARALFGYENGAARADSPIEGGIGPHIDVAIYTTSAMAEVNRDIDETIARFTAEALDRAGFSYTVSFDYNPVELDAADTNKSAVFDAWKSQSVRASDANLLCRDARGGGVAQFEGRYGVMGVNNVDVRLPVTETGETRAHDNIRGAIHEIGHMLGGLHKDNMVEAPGMFYNDSAIDDFHEYTRKRYQPTDDE